jgi:hypothetical protein
MIKEEQVPLLENKAVNYFHQIKEAEGLTGFWEEVYKIHFLAGFWIAIASHEEGLHVKEELENEISRQSESSLKCTGRPLSENEIKAMRLGCDFGDNYYVHLKKNDFNVDMFMG